MIYEYALNNIRLQTGDIICTTNGIKGSHLGRFWQLVGRIIPGEVDHVAIYIGPNGRCVEAAANGVVSFEFSNKRWNAKKMYPQRELLDKLIGIAYPLAKRGLPREAMEQIRMGVAHFCLTQAIDEKPYNPIYFAPQMDAAYYCSQLIYKAYLAYGIDLSMGPSITPVPNDAQIVLPQAIWQNVHKRKSV